MKKYLMSCLVAISVFAASLAMVSCSKKHQEPSAKGLPGGFFKTANYTVPHPNPAAWRSTGHIEYYVKFGKNIQGTPQSCNRCHNGTQIPGTPKNLSCAIQCHTPESASTGQASVPTSPIAKEAESCLECHKDNFTRKNPHYPAASGLCATCHTVKDAHEVSKDSKTVITDSTNQACMNCHGRVVKHQNAHASATMEGGCVFCHDPHGSDHTYFTRDKIPDLCMQCHYDILGDKQTSVHGIIPETNDNKKGCTNCHNPHSSDFKPLLKEKREGLCLSCHDRTFDTTKGATAPVRILPNIKEKTHGPHPHPGAQDDDSCTFCHSPHASQYTRLLKDPYPTVPYAKYVPAKDDTPDTYALCFNCHTSSLLSPDITADDTQFRNDTVGPDNKTKRFNLHWWHVVSATGYQDLDKGRTCFTCHDPHGSTQDHTIRTSFDLNGTKVNINYTATPTGGECAFTCHSTKKYERIVQ